MPSGIHGPVQVSVLPFDPDVGFVDTVACIGAFQVSAAPLVQFRPAALDPTQMQLEFMSRARSSAISAIWEKEIGNLRYHHTSENDIARIVTPFEGIRRGDGHASPYQILIQFSQRYRFPLVVTVLVTVQGFRKAP